MVTLLVPWHPPPKSSPCHQTQFRIPRNISALCIFRVKLYFQSFMSNLNSWSLHSDLDRILNLSWPPNPFHKTHGRARVSTHTHTDVNAHIYEFDCHSLSLSQSLEFWMTDCLLVRALRPQVSLLWKQGYCTMGSSPLRWSNHISTALVWDENGPSNFLWHFPLFLKLKSLSILTELNKLVWVMKNGSVCLWTYRSVVSTKMRSWLGIKPTKIPYQQLTIRNNIWKKRNHSQHYH